MEHEQHQIAEVNSEGLRERNRRARLNRITQTGIELFAAKGYEETTLDEIAAAAGISRRTFFHYFKSKDEILLAWQAGVSDSIRAAVLNEPIDQSPLDALCCALLKMSSQFDKGAAIQVARILQSNEQLRAANQAKLVRMEHAAFEALCLRWPQRGRIEGLRLVAMVGLGAFRLAIEQWTEEGGKTSLKRHIEKTFARLRAEIERDRSQAN